MAFKIIEEHDALPERDPLLVLYGEAGSGKTSLSFTAANPLLLDFDQGVSRCVGRKRNVSFDTWHDVLELMQPGGYLETNKPGTLIIDTGGAMLDELMSEFIIHREPRLGKSSGELNLQGYGALKQLFAAFLRRCKVIGVLPVFVCHVSEKGDGDERRMRPKMTGGAYDILIGKADLVGYVEMKGNTRTISFSPTSRTVGKNCVEFPTLEVPHYESPKYHTFLQDIIDATRQRLAKMTLAQQQALDEVKAVQDMLAECATFPALEAALAKLETLPPIYQAQTRPSYVTRYVAIWQEHHLDDAETAEQFTKLVGVANDLDESVQVKVKKAIVAAAKKRGYVWNAEGDVKAFVLAEPTPEQPQVMQAVTTEPAKSDAGTSLDQHLSGQQPARRTTRPAA
jgi:hypothetical protein